MVYQWKSASRIKADAQAAGAVFEQLEQTVGLTPKTLLDESRPEDAPLHGEFEWDDSKAAEAYRETQASFLIRMLCVAPENELEEVKQPVRAFFKTQTASQYESVFTICAAPEKRTALFDVAKKELDAFVAKYSMLEEFAELFAEIARLGL